MSKYIPSFAQIVKNMGAILIGGFLAAGLVREFPAYKKWIDAAFLP